MRICLDKAFIDESPLLFVQFLQSLNDIIPDIEFVQLNLVNEIGEILRNGNEHLHEDLENKSSHYNFFKPFYVIYADRCLCLLSFQLAPILDILVPLSILDIVQRSYVVLLKDPSGWFEPCIVLVVLKIVTSA